MFSRVPGKPVPTRAGSESVELEESLGALERARHFGTSKLSLQRLVFVSELVDCAHDIGYEATVVHLLPMVRKLASDPEVLVRQSLVGHFGDLAGFLIQSDPEKGYQKVVDDVLPTVSLLLHEQASEVRQGAAEALTTLASHLRPGERGDQVLMSVITLSHSNDDEDARTTAVQLLNSLAEALGEDLCQQFVGVELVALCQDPSFKVRKATAASFAEVAKIAGEAYVLKRLVPAFSELVKDTHWGVRKAASENLVAIAMTISAEMRQKSLVSLVDELLKDISRWVRVSTLQQLGYFIAALELAEWVPEALLRQYVDVIQQSKANPDAADISYHCAYTFAAVTKTMGKDWWSSLEAPFATLCNDVQAKTRKAMAASLHIVAQTLGPELTEKEALQYFESLLQDQAAEVRQAAMRNIPNMLRSVPGGASHRRILKALQGGMMGKGDNWRLRQHAASQLGPICAALVEVPDPSSVDEQKDLAAVSATWATGEGASSSSKPQRTAAAKDMALSVIVPLFLQLCADSVAQVRDAAAKSAAGILRAAAPELFLEPGVQHEGSSGGSSGEKPQAGTNDLVRRLIKTFAHAKVFRSRMAFIRMVDSVIRECPPNIFSELFLQSYLPLSTDRVKNVRVLWATLLLPHLRVVGRLGQNQLVQAAAKRMLRTSASAASKDDEVARLLRIHLAEVPDDEDLPEVPADPYLDDSDNGDGCKEGGTGDSSECSSAGVVEPEEQEDDSRDAKSPQRDEPSSASSSAQPALEAGPRPESTGEPAEHSSSASSAHSPHGPQSPKASSPGHKSPLQKPSTPPGHDAVEDGLVEQVEMEKAMDAEFADRRLLAEAEANLAALELNSSSTSGYSGASVNRFSASTTDASETSNADTSMQSSKETLEETSSEAS
eukprot:TRINITY_DN43320_c0_g1_i1.p1 TRINITY_DN43320_c0_g1~~TRINITY_DN43320_c0_g1_i1.p1  ORF type:complete len:893 (-),score=212.10 TRINITY_DN43320_c0_g1_i1:51-2729(-)